MPRVIRRAVGVAALTLLMAASIASAGAPEGPRLAVVRLDAKPLRLELLTVDPSGALPVKLAGGGRRSGPAPYFFSPPSWSPGGDQIAFSATVGRRKGEEGPQLAIFLAAADGHDLHRIPKTANGYGPVFSPDGAFLAFTRSRQREVATMVHGKLRKRSFEAAAIWLLDLATGVSRRLTPWRNGLEYFASSFSPDGSKLLATRQDDRRTDDPEPVALNVATGAAARLLVDGAFPVYSPDGSEVAFVR